MKISKVLFCSLSVVLLSSSAAFAQKYGALEAEIEALREDVTVLQRNAYRSSSDNEFAPGSSADVALRIGEFDENMRKINGRLDELGYKIKTMDERLNMINRDIDVRIKMLEGAPITGGNLGGGIDAPREKFKVPVANGAPKAILGDNISTGNDLPNVQTKSVDEIYQSGLEALKTNNYDVAERSFDSVLRRFPNDKLAGNAQYWLGEVYYGRKDYAKAAAAFAKGIEKYKDGAKGADSLLKLGLAMNMLGKKTEACAAFVNLKTEFPKATDELKKRAATEVAKLSCK